MVTHSPQGPTAPLNGPEHHLRAPLPELSEVDKLTAIRGLVTSGFEGHEQPDVFFSFSGGVGPSPRPEAYRSLPYSSVSEHGIATGGRTRVIATAEIAKAFPELPIITNSYNRFDPKEPTMASIIKQELIQRGVDEGRIEEETNSFSTVTQLTEMIKLSVKEGWKRVAVMTNEYHQPRVQAMLDRLDTIIDDAEFQKTLAAFREQGTEVVLVNAEPVMRITDPHFAAYLERVEQTPQYQHTLATEAQGLKDLEAGRYRVTLTPENPRS